MVRTKNILSILLVALYISYYTSTIFFVHTHQYEWGTVTHSHPHSSGSHSHSTNALQFIYNLTNLLFVAGFVVFCMAILPVSKALFLTVETRHTTSLHIDSNQLRAPPVLV